MRREGARDMEKNLHRSPPKCHRSTFSTTAIRRAVRGVAHVVEGDHGRRMRESSSSGLCCLPFHTRAVGKSSKDITWSNLYVLNLVHDVDYR